MAQLSDDCFAFSGPLMPVDEVERLVQERVAPATGSEPVALAEACGRVLAADVVAGVDLPPPGDGRTDHGFPATFQNGWRRRQRWSDRSALRLAVSPPGRCVSLGEKSAVQCDPAAQKIVRSRAAAGQRTEHGVRHNSRITDDVEHL